MTSCVLVNIRRRFGGGRCLHLQCICSPKGSVRTAQTLKVKVAGSSEMSVEYLQVALVFYSRELEYSTPPWTLNHSKVSVPKWDIPLVAWRDVKESVFYFKNLLPRAFCKCLRRNWQFVTYVFFLTTFSVVLTAAFAWRDWQKWRRIPAVLSVSPSRFEVGTRKVRNRSADHSTTKCDELENYNGLVTLILCK
jgi:hypothetical protein